MPCETRMGTYYTFLFFLDMDERSLQSIHKICMHCCLTHKQGVIVCHGGNREWHKPSSFVITQFAAAMVSV